nr:vegetative cell wall protein gp1-like [Meriones unguiculatus]XP_021515143.1 vegetative cell wall protein gp1-like [Meriones unguiculatus]
MHYHTAIVKGFQRRDEKGETALPQRLPKNPKNPIFRQGPEAPAPSRYPREGLQLQTGPLGPGTHLSPVRARGALKEGAATRAALRLRSRAAPSSADPSPLPSPRGPRGAAPSSPCRAALTSALVALPPSAFWASAPQQLPSSLSHPQFGPTARPAPQPGDSAPSRGHAPFLLSPAPRLHPLALRTAAVPSLQGLEYYVPTSSAPLRLLVRQSVGHSKRGVLAAFSAASASVQRGPGTDSLTCLGVGKSEDNLWAPVLFQP